MEASDHGSSRRSCPTCGATFPPGVEYCALDGGKLADGPDPLIGRSFDRYRIDAILGDGGMARVYRATHSFLGQEVALKVLYGELLSTPDFAARFHREAQFASKLRHEHIVPITDFGKSEHGVPFMVMELVRGRPLSAVPPLSRPAAVAALIRQIASALVAAHAHGLVHRDLKPGNVMLEERAGGFSARLLDFGLVYAVGDESSTRLTRTGQILGTPTYMAPEQVTGGEVTAATDLYALGVMLYEQIAGGPPFRGDVSVVLAQHLGVAPPPPPHAGGLGPLALALLAKAPGDRPRSAEELVARIDALVAAGLGDPPSASPRRWPWLLVLAVPALGLGVAALWPSAPPPEVQAIEAEVLPEPRDVPPKRQVRRSHSRVRPEARAARGARREEIAIEVPEETVSVEAPEPELEPRDRAATEAHEVGELKRRLATLDESDRAPIPLRVQRLEKQAIDAIAVHRYTSAEIHLDLCLQLDPRAARCHKLQGFVYEANGRRARAAAAYERYLEHAPRAPDAKEIRAKIAALRK